jgi:formylglycine-generating enzyme required for sulfatase activity
VIGRGAYGEIWLARSLTGAWRAVKVVSRVTFESERAFQREFQGMSAFEPISRAHDGFVDILHVGRTRDYLYYIMELADDHVAGRDIDSIRYEPRTLKSDLARHKNLSAGESIRLGLSLTQALHALHACSLTHRDIKPSNIIFIDGVPKLADIGLVAITGQNSFVGTEGYVPPEGPGTAQADIFSLGKLLYEVSTGKDRLDFPEIDSRLSTRPDKEELAQLNDVLVKACANDPKKRYASAAAMHKDLEALDRGEIPAPPKRPIKYIIAAAAILLLILGVAVFRWHILPDWLSPPFPPTDFRGRATIQTDPPGALVILGDHAQKSPAVFEELEQRKYKLRIMAPGYEPLETMVDLNARNAAQPPVFRLARSMGRLEIQSKPAGVKFSIRAEDGNFTRDGNAPFTFSDLPTGKYSISATRGDWEMHDAIEVVRGETAHKLFAFIDAPVSVTSEPNGAQISVDGQSRGKTPLQLQLSARGHEIVAHLDGWPDERKQVEVETEGENPAHFVFANGRVKITSAPAGATVLANGRELGQTPLVIEEVKPGPVSYELRLAGYKSKLVPGQVEPQQQLFLAEYLERTTIAQGPGQTWTNSLGMKFVAVGEIQMSIWETRIQDYDAFCSATGRRRNPPDFPQAPTHPVVKVNWFDATAFCQWLTEKERQENILSDRQLYRLPGDAEWSRAVGLPNEGGSTPEARDGKIRNEFPWGKQWPPPSGAGNYADRSARASERARGGVIENYADGFAQTAPAGSFKANALGLYDLGGNVWEWCAESYNGKTGTRVRDWGVLRGGSWATSKRMELQSSYRNVVDRSDRDVIYGFRCVLAPQTTADTENH